MTALDMMLHLCYGVSYKTNGGELSHAMIGQWDEFTAGPTKPRNERLHVTMNPKGVIFLNQKMHEVMGKPAAAILLFDRRNSLIGIKPANAKHAFPLKKKSVGTGRIIHASPFCRHHGVNIDRPIVFHNPDLDDDGTLMLDLQTATHIGRKKAAHPSRDS